MKRIVMMQTVALVMAAMMVASALPALADPVNQPSTEHNCHGALVARFASGEPEGVGNFVGGQNVKEVQQSFRHQCEETQE